LLIIAVGILVQGGHAQRAYTQSEALPYAKSIDVHTLDSALPKQRLEDWFREKFPGSVFNWEVADTCDLMPTRGETGYPLCVKIRGGTHEKGFETLIEIGTYDKGIVGVPKLYYGAGVWIVNPYTPAGSTEHLSELPALFVHAGVHSR
jgi:hypothetical protein